MSLYCRPLRTDPCRGFCIAVCGCKVTIYFLIVQVAGGVWILRYKNSGMTMIFAVIPLVMIVFRCRSIGDFERLFGEAVDILIFGAVSVNTVRTYKHRISRVDSCIGTVLLESVCFAIEDCDGFDAGDV